MESRISRFVKEKMGKVLMVSRERSMRAWDVDAAVSLLSVVLGDVDVMRTE